jgi:hypothetical protein
VLAVPRITLLESPNLARAARGGLQGHEHSRRRLGCAGLRGFRAPLRRAVHAKPRSVPADQRASELAAAPVPPPPRVIRSGWMSR